LATRAPAWSRSGVDVSFPKLSVNQPTSDRRPPTTDRRPPTADRRPPNCPAGESAIFRPAEQTSRRTVDQRFCQSANLPNRQFGEPANCPSIARSTMSADESGCFTVVTRTGAAGPSALWLLDSSTVQPFDRSTIHSSRLHVCSTLQRQSLSIFAARTIAPPRVLIRRFAESHSFMHVTR
jgi:hypothetical protein